MSSAPILLVAGPSGGGKSTFIRQMQQRALAPIILENLPKGSDHWPMVEANDITKGRLSPQSMPCNAPGIVMHYDIAFIERLSIRDYRDDPALALLMNSPSLHMVFVKPDHETVRRQFLERLAAHKKGKSRLSLFWSRFFRLPMRRLLSPLTEKPTISTERIYEDRARLASCYRNWELFKDDVLARHGNARCMTVEPAAAGLAFKIIATHAQDA